MLKWYADMFKLSGKELTSAALKRIKWLTVLSLPAMPLIITDVFGGVPDEFAVPYVTIMIISLVSFFCLCFTKFVNRFCVPDRYLDEWEKARKHQAMAFAFQVMCFAFSAVLIFGVISDFFPIFENVRIRSLDTYEIGVVAVGVMMFGLYTMHAYLLFKIRPFDEIEMDDSVPEVAE